MVTWAYPLEGCEDADVLDGGYNWLDPTDSGRTFHPGVDLNAGYGGDADKGRLILSVAGGVVRHVTHWDGWTAGFGTHLWIEQDDGHWVHHAHLDEVLVGVGQRVERGDALGRCGKSGWQKWAHDHAEVCRSRPQSWTQWPRSWSRADVEAVYRNPHEYFAEKQTEATFSVPTEGDDMQGIIDELNAQVAALRAEVDGAAGITTELGKQVNSLSWLLSLSQGETHAQAAEVARLQSLLAAPGDTAAEVEAVEVRLSGGKVALLTR